MQYLLDGGAYSGLNVHGVHPQKVHPLSSPHASWIDMILAVEEAKN